MTLTRQALRVLNELSLTPAERNAVIVRATTLAKVIGCLGVVPVWFVRNALTQLGLDQKREVING